MYDAAEDRWSALPEMLEARQGCGAVLLPLPRSLPMTMAERGGGVLTPEQRTDWGQEDGARSQWLPVFGGNLPKIVLK